MAAGHIIRTKWPHVGMFGETWERKWRSPVRRSDFSPTKQRSLRNVSPIAGMMFTVFKLAVAWRMFSGNSSPLKTTRTTTSARSEPHGRSLVWLLVTLTRRRSAPTLPTASLWWGAAGPGGRGWRCSRSPRCEGRPATASENVFEPTDVARRSIVVHLEDRRDVPAPAWSSEPLWVLELGVSWATCRSSWSVLWVHWTRPLRDKDTCQLYLKQRKRQVMVCCRKESCDLHWST